MANSAFLFTAELCPTALWLGFLCWNLGFQCDSVSRSDGAFEEEPGGRSLGGPLGRNWCSSRETRSHERVVVRAKD